MILVCNEVTRNECLEIFDFDWSMSPNAAAGKLFESNVFYSYLDGKIAFQINIVNEKVPPNYSMKVGLRKRDKLKCDMRAVLMFEILNDVGEVYHKKTLKTQISQSNLECFCDRFDIPMMNMGLNGHGGNLMYFNTFKIRGQIVIYLNCQKKINFPAPLGENLNHLQNDLKYSFLNKTYADVEFDIGGEVIHAHKNILSSRSIVFRKMFEQDMKEKEGNTVQITDIEKSVFNVFLIFLYTGEIEDKKLNVVMPLYSVADKYAVKTLFKTCSNLLDGYISETTVAPILKLADMHNDATLREKAINFICSNFANVADTESWNTLLNTDPRLTSNTLKQVATTLASPR